MKALARFLFDDVAPYLVDGTGIQPDPELAARNMVRIRDAKKLLGDKWLCWNPRPPRDEAAANDDATRAAQSRTPGDFWEGMWN